MVASMEHKQEPQQSSTPCRKAAANYCCARNNLPVGQESDACKWISWQRQAEYWMALET